MPENSTLKEESEMIKCFQVALVFIIVSATSPASGAVPAGCDDSLIPTEARTLVNERFPKWKVLLLTDLVKDDQELWLKSHPNECPGIALGHFDNLKELSYAITLIHRENGKLRQVLLVVSKGPDKKYRLKILNKPSSVAGASVVIKMAPGTYTSFDDSKKINIRFDAITYEKIEAGAIMYYWVRGVYRFLQTSE